MVLIKTILATLLATFVSAAISAIVSTIFKTLKKVREDREFSEDDSREFLDESDLQDFEKDFVQVILNNYSLHNGIINQDGILLRYAKGHYWDDLLLGRICYSFGDDTFDEDDDDLEPEHYWSVVGERYFICFNDGSVEMVPYIIRTSILEEKSLIAKGLSVSDHIFSLTETRRAALLYVIKEEIYISGYVNVEPRSSYMPIIEDVPYARIEFVFYQQ